MAEMPTPGQPTSLVCTESDARCGGILRRGANPNSGARLQEPRAAAVGRQAVVGVQSHEADAVSRAVKSSDSGRPCTYLRCICRSGGGKTGAEARTPCRSKHWRRLLTQASCTFRSPRAAKRERSTCRCRPFSSICSAPDGRSMKSSSPRAEDGRIFAVLESPNSANSAKYVPKIPGTAHPVLADAALRQASQLPHPWYGA